MIFVLVSLLLTLIGFSVLLLMQVRLVWEELTPQELEALQQTVRPEPEMKMTLSGSGGILSSPWSWIASRLFPGVLLVDAKINGRDVTLVVDTGITVEEFLLLYADTARTVGIRLTTAAPSVAVPGQDRQFPAFRGIVDRLELGELVVQLAPVRVVAARQRLKALGLTLFQVDGFVGISFLERFAVTWDLQRNYLEVRQQLVERSGLTALLHKAEHELAGQQVRFYYVEGFIDGQGPYKILIDTGASTPSLLVSGRIAQAYGASQKQFRIGHLKLGEIELEDLPALNVEALLGRAVLEGLPIEMILGTGLLKVKGFKSLTLDFLAGKLYAER